jgi:ethanolamine utilization protein EutN
VYLGRVVGTVVANRICEGLAGSKLLLVQPLDDSLADNGRIHAAVDTVRAGPGDLVYLVGSREAALALEPWFVPVDAAIVGVVDQLHRPGREEAGS